MNVCLSNNQLGYTALHFAILACLDCLWLALEQGQEPHLDLSIVESLLARGADPNLKTDRNETVRDYLDSIPPGAGSQFERLIARLGR